MYGIRGIGTAVLLLVLAIPALSAEDTSVLLEKAIYTEEMLGKLSDAIAIYRQIVNTADMNRDIAAMAVYRLGMCYRKLGSETEAFSTFSSLARLYPEKRDLISKSLFLNMRPVPWADGEIMRLSQKRIGTENMGGSAFGTYSVESGLEAGKPVWHLRYAFGAGRSPVYYSAIAADAATMLPISSRFRRNQTSLESKFAPDRIEVVNLQDSSQPARQIQSTGAVFDAWQIVPIVRRLPLQLGFEAAVPVFESSSGTFGNVRIRVTGRETVTVPAGTFECHKVVMISDDSLPNEQTFWVTADSHAYIARVHLDRINEFELQSVQIAANNQPVIFEVPGEGIGLSATQQWYLSSMSEVKSVTASGTIGKAGNAIQIGAPELDSDLSVVVFEVQPDRPYQAKMPDSISQNINGAEFRLQIRPGTRENVTVAGFTGQRFIADVHDPQSDGETVQYTYLLTSPAKACTFTFRTGKDNFDKMRSTFDSIMSSVKVQ